MQIRQPVRVTHRYVQTLHAPPDAVFPLLCPVREVEWVHGWMPGLVVSASGVAERDCAFTTPDEEGREATWVITEHDATAGVVEMVKVTPGHLVTRLRITLSPADERCTHATVSYTYTALGPEGEARVRALTPEAYADFMRTWEREMNAYLRRKPA